MNNFNILNFYDEKEKLIRKEIADEWEKIDYSLFKNKNKKYQVVKFKFRKIKTMYGLITFKRRIYRYYNIQLQKWIYTALLDEYLQIKKYKRFYKDVYEHVINFLGDGKRYRDIRDTMAKTNISNMTISRFFQNFKLKLKVIEKVKVTDNETIYINMDDCFLNLNRLKKINYKFRVISFNTGIKQEYNKRPELKNKRVAILDGKNGGENYVDFIWKKINQYYEFDNAKIVIGGDGALWIRNLAKYYGANYVFDRWHALRLLWAEYKPNMIRRRYKMDTDKYSNFMQAKKYFLAGQYDELLNFLKSTNVTKATLSIFKANQEGIQNQSKKWNIGVSAESDVFHFVKSLKGNGSKIYNEKTFLNMVQYKIAKFNNTLFI